MQAAPGENLITGKTIAEQIAQAARMESEKGGYRDPAAVLANTAACLTRLDAALAQSGVPLAVTELGRFLTVAQSGGEGLQGIYTHQSPQMASPAIMARIHIEELLETSSPTLTVAGDSLALSLHHTHNLSVNEEEAWAEVNSKYHAFHTALFIGKAAVGVCMRHFAASRP